MFTFPTIPTPDPLLLPPPVSRIATLATHRSGQADPSSRFFIRPGGGGSNNDSLLPPPPANDDRGGRPFGRSLHYDAYGVASSICNDVGFCYRLLDDLTKYVCMSQQAPPYVFLSPSEYPDKAGISAWVPLIESGISLHTLSVTRFCSLDLYTCGDLNAVATVDWLCDRLQPKLVEYQVLIRGLNYYQT